MKQMSRGILWISALAVVRPLPATEIQTDVCIVGGGSGGTAAAIAAIREGVQVVLVEKQAILGGTSTAGLVCLWGATPAESIAREIYDDLAAKGKAGVAKRLGKVPYHCWTIDPTLSYESTLKARANRIPFDPDAFSETALGILRSHGATVMLKTVFETAETEGRHVTSIEVRHRDGSIDRIRAKVFIDATGDVFLCRSAGCETVIGDDLNGVTLCYRVTKTGKEDPRVLAAQPLKRTSCNHQLPNGDRVINMLPTLAGEELLKLGYDAAMEKCQTLVRRHWAWLRQGPGEWKEYHFAEAAPLLGIREGYRIIAEYTLAAQDLKAGIEKQSHADMIAMGAHGVDVHGNRKTVKHVKVKPYGIPYRCLIPKDWENILVPCRGGGFDRVAASSVRLSRTMMWLGHAAGVAAAMAVADDVTVSEVDRTALVAKVGLAAFSSAEEGKIKKQARP